MNEPNGNSNGHKIVEALTPCHPDLPAHYYEVHISGIAHETVATVLADQFRSHMPPGMSVHVERVWADERPTT